MLLRISGIPALFLLLLFSCKGKDEPIPAYLHIDSVSVNVQSGQGNPIHDIHFVHAYIDGELLGVFELPATIPVHAANTHKITLTPAVLLNGSNNMVVVHTGFLPTDTSVNFTRGKISTVSNVVFSFRNNVDFVWLEDFEDNSSTVSVISAVENDTAFISNEFYSLKGRFEGTSKVFTADIKATDTAKYLDLGSFNTFNNLPNNATDIFLEFDLRSDIPVHVALRRSNSSGTFYVPYLFIYSTEKKWKRFYVNLNYETGGQPAGTTYQILFNSDVEAGSAARIIQLDNIRLSFNN